MERSFGFVGEHDVADFSLAKPDCERAAVGIEVTARDAGEFGIATPRQQRRLHQFAEVRCTSIDQLAGLSGSRDIAPRPRRRA